VRSAVSLLAESGDQRAKSLLYPRDRAQQLPIRTKQIWRDLEQKPADFYQNGLYTLRKFADTYGDNLAIDTAKEVAGKSGNRFLANAASKINSAQEAYQFLIDLNKQFHDGRAPWMQSVINSARMEEGPFARAARSSGPAK